MNVLPTDADMPGFLSAAKTALKAGVDAAIVSDTGAALMLGEEVPGLALHISTQANVLNARTALHFHRALGAERIVLSRELSLAGIAAMRAVLPPELELEAFVHGAMCVAYSLAVAFLSAALAGRSGNPGSLRPALPLEVSCCGRKKARRIPAVCEDENGAYLFSCGRFCVCCRTCLR